MKGMIIALCCSVGLSGFAFWLAWYKVLGWLLAQIPPDASWAFFGKIISIGLVGYFGGIAVPLIVFFLPIMVWSKK